MEYTRKELMRRLSDYLRRGLTNQQLYDLIDSLWRDPPSPRTSGFDLAGGTDSVIEATSGLGNYNGIFGMHILFSIAPLAKKFKFYHYRHVLALEKKQELESIVFLALEGLHIVYYEKDPETKRFVLQTKYNPNRSDLEDIVQYSVMIAAIYFDAEKEEIIYFGDNRHGSLWNPWIHWSWHQTFNSMRETGLELTDLVPDGDGSEEKHAQFGISAGSCFHEDIYVTAESKDKPADLPVWYIKQGSHPRIHENSVNSLVVDGTLCYNSGGDVIPADDGYFVMYHIFFTNDILEPFISVMGQAQYDKVSTASLMSNNEVQQVKDLLPHQNMLHIGTLLFQTSANFGNSYKSRIVSQAWGVITRWSVEGDGSAANPVQLKNDEENPGADHFYGTDIDGVKGYFPFPEIPEGEDNYVDGATFDEDTRDLTLQRTGDLEDIVVNIPCVPAEEIATDVLTPRIKYGHLYNWFAATDARNIAPVGFHVPTNAEFIILITELGGYDQAGKIKETGLIHWNSPNTAATNESGFTARGSGVRSGFDGEFYSLKDWFGMWSSTENSPTTGKYQHAQTDLATFVTEGLNNDIKGNAISLRFVKNDSTDPGTVTGNNGVVYRTVKIGDQVWTAENSVETEYQNHDSVTGPDFTNEEWAALTTEAYCIYGNEIENASATLLEHNKLSGKQGGDVDLDEFYHHTLEEIEEHVYEAPKDDVNYVRKNGAWEEMPESSGVGVEDIAFDFNDVEEGVAQTWVLDVKASFAYNIISAVIESDSTMDDLAIKIDGTAVGGMSAIDVTTGTSETSATSANSVAIDSRVTMVSSGTDGNPTLIRGKLKIQRT